MESSEHGHNAEQINQKELKPQEALDQERGIFEQFKSKGKEVASVLFLVSVLSTAPGLTQEAYAQRQKQQFVKTEQTYRHTKEQNTYVAQVLEALEDFRRGIADANITEWRNRVCGLQSPKDRSTCENNFEELLAIEHRIKDSLLEAETKARDLNEAGVEHAVLKVSISFMRYKIQVELLDEKYRNSFKNRIRNWLKERLQ